MRIRSAVLSAALFLPLFGQTFGEIGGLVTDASGASVPGAKITVINAATNLTRSSESNDVGNYNFPALPPGTYSVRVEKEGFQAEVQPSLLLQVQQSVRLDFRLNVGSVSEIAQVTGAAPLLNTENAAVGTVIENRRIVDLPINGRSFVSLVSLSPNVVSGQVSNVGAAAARTGGDRIVSLSIAGMRRTFTYFSLDGVSNTDVDFSTFAFLPSIDALDEFKVQTGVYSAEFGRNAAQVNVSTKSGTNRYHGALFEFLRNNKLDARPFGFSSVPASAPLRWNQFGFTVGGPVQIPKLFDGKNKLFFMSNYEGFRLRNQAQQTLSTPPASMRAGNFSQLLPSTLIRDRLDNRTPFPGNIIPPTRFARVSKQLLEFYPLPNVGSGLLNNYLALQNNSTDKDQFTQRVDFIQNTKSSWFGRYNWQSDGSYSPIWSEVANKVSTTVKMAMISNTRILSPSIVNEFRFGYLGYHNLLTTGLAYKRDVVRELRLPVLQPTDPISWGIPAVTIQGFSALGDSSQNPFVAHDHTFQWMDGLSWVRGAHSLKFGAELRRDRYNPLGNMASRGTYAFTASPLFTGYAFSDYMLGDVANDQNTVELAAGQFRATSQYYYATDSWKVRPNLTIDMGLRYEFTPVWSSRGDNIINVLVPSMQPEDFQPNAPSSHTPYFARNCAAYGQTEFYRPGTLIRYDKSIPTKCVSDLGTTLVKNDPTNFAPRLGVAWSPKANLTVRAGLGIFFTQDIGNMYFDTARTVGGRTVAQSDSTNILTWDNPIGTAAANLCGVPVPPYVCVVSPYTYTNEPGRRTPYIVQYELNIQRQLSNTTVLEVGYLGSQGHFLQRISVFGGATPGPGSVTSRQPFPQFNALQYNQATSNSNYHSGTMKLTRRLSKGLSALVGYTFSRSMDTGSAYYPDNGNTVTKPQAGFCLRCEYGRSDFDSRQRFVASILYELPFGKGKQFVNQGWASYVLGGWQLNSIVTKSSGFPLVIADAINQSNTNVNADRPNAVYGVSAKLDNPTPNQWFNVRHVQLQPLYTFGNVGRNTVTSPGVFSWDFSTLKNFNFTERTYLQFRFECFNCANHPNFGNPGVLLGANLRDASGIPLPGTGPFGQITSTLPGISMRTLQFSLKLIF